MNETSQNSKIPVVILCGGTGTRLREETEYKPKPMVDVGGKPILWHIMKIYGHFGYKNFVLALGYKGEVIRDYFLKQKYHEQDFLFSHANGEATRFFDTANARDDFNILFADTGLETPHGERVLKVRHHLTEDIFMVTYGDGVADIDIEKLVAFHKQHGKMVTVTGVHPESRWGLVNTDENDLITEFAQKPMLYDYVNGGFMVCNKEFLNYLRPGDMIEDPLKLLVPLKQAMLYKHEGFWYGMDTYKDFLHLNKLWDAGAPWKIWSDTPSVARQQSSNVLPVPEWKPAQVPTATPSATQETILITGGAGFIGGNLAQELARQGKRVVVVDDLSSGRKENVPTSAMFYHMDVRDKELANVFAKEKPTTVFHFAARPLVEDALRNPYDALETNIMGTVNVLEICRKQGGISSIVIVSSDKAYGKAQQLPYTESFPLRGNHPYDASKSSADLIAQTYAVTYGMPVKITRFSNVFGPGDANSSRIIPGIVQAVMDRTELVLRSDGTMVREYTFVKDIVDGCIKLASHQGNYGEAFNFGSENVMNVLDVIKKAEAALVTNIPYRIENTAKNEIQEQYLDWTKAREVLGWKPQVSFETGIRETFDWLKQKKFVA